MRSENDSDSYSDSDWIIVCLHMNTQNFYTYNAALLTEYVSVWQL